MIRGGLIIDPGHGGLDCGTCHNGVVESVYVLAMANLVRHHLAELGIVAHLTRDGDTDPSFAERARKSLDLGAAGTIVLHVNSGDPREHGPLAFWRDDDPVGWRAAQTFINCVHRGGIYQVDDHTSRPMRWQVHVARPQGWTSRMWRCLEQHALPVVGLELEYCTHPESARWLLQETERIALAVAECGVALLG